MRIAIARLHTRASLPRRLQTIAPSIERLMQTTAVEQAPAALADALPGDRALWRIRRVHLRMQVSARELDSSGLTEQWRQEFRRALLAALQDGETEVVSAASRAEWIAGLVLRRLQGRPVEGWAYGELAEAAGGALSSAFEAALSGAQGETSDVLIALDRAGALERLLNGCDEAACARICGVLDRERPQRAAPVDIEGVIALARLLVRHPGTVRDRRSLYAHATAILLFVRQLEEGGGNAVPPMQPGAMLTALRILDVLCGLQRAFGPHALLESLDAVLARFHTPHPALRELLRRTWYSQANPGSARPDVTEAQRTLAELIARVSTVIPAAGAEAQRHVTVRSVASACAGLLLLAPLVQAVDWSRRIRSSPLWDVHRDRAIAYLLAGVGAALVDREDTPTGLDPAIAVFAGCLEDFQVAGFPRFCAEGGADEFARSTWRALLDDCTPASSPPETWDELCARLGDHLVRQFADRLRGFRKSSHAFMVSSFLAVPGLILVETGRVHVALDPNPLWVAVHLAGGDSDIDWLDWIPGRRLTFELGGL